MSKLFIIEFILYKEIFFVSVKGFDKEKFNLIFAVSSLVLTLLSVVTYFFSTSVKFSVIGDEIEILLESISGFVRFNLFSILFIFSLLSLFSIISFWVVITWFIWLLLLSGNKFILFCSWLIFCNSFCVVVVLISWVTVVVVIVIVCVTCWLLIVWIFVLISGILAKLCSSFFILMFVLLSVLSVLIFSFSKKLSISKILLFLMLEIEFLQHIFGIFLICFSTLFFL